MTEPIRNSLKPKVDGYLSQAQGVDVSKWRWGCLHTAGRVAMLLSCDVEEAVSCLLRLRGMEDITEDQRASVLAEAPECVDLMRFAVSENYFKLREALGLALRRSK